MLATVTVAGKPCGTNDTNNPIAHEKLKATEKLRAIQMIKNIKVNRNENREIFFTNNEMSMVNWLFLLLLVMVILAIWPSKLEFPVLITMPKHSPEAIIVPLKIRLVASSGLLLPLLKFRS